MNIETKQRSGGRIRQVSQPDDVRVGFNAPKKIADKLNARANKENKTLTLVVNEALAAYL